MVMVRALLVAFVGAILFAGWQQITVARNFEGNWTALFCTGSKQPVPPALQPGTYRVSNPNGFDGQMYRYVAHDPFLTGESHNYLDNAPLRARRILIPGLAWLLAFGRQRWIDGTYILLFWAAVFAGIYWFALYMNAHGQSLLWSLLFLALPATLIATDRLIIDLVSCALTGGLLLYADRNRWRMVFVMLLLGCLCRETGFIPAMAFTGAAVFQRHWRRALLVAGSTLPAVVWYAYVQFRLGRIEIPAWVGKTSEIGPLKWLLHPYPYPFAAPIMKLAQTLDALAILGMLLAFGLAVAFGLSCGLSTLRSPVRLTALLFAASSVATMDSVFWNETYSFSRPYSPLLAILALRGISASRRAWVWVLPIFFIDLRIAFQLSPQLLGLVGINVAT